MNTRTSVVLYQRILAHILSCSWCWSNAMAITGCTCLFSSSPFRYQYQCKWRPGKIRLRNDLSCVDVDVKPCSTQLQCTYFVKCLCCLVVIVIILLSFIRMIITPIFYIADTVIVRSAGHTRLWQTAIYLKMPLNLPRAQSTRSTTSVVSSANTDIICG